MSRTQRSYHKLAERINFSVFTSSLKSRNFRLLFFGFLISLTGIWMQWVAQSWIMFKLTNSSLMLGLLGFAANIPIFLLAPLGGAVADKYSRQHILFITQVLSVLFSLLMALLTIFGYLQVWQIFVFAFITGIINAFDIPTHQAFLADIVEKKDLMNAISLHSSILNFTRIIGPLLAGIIIVEWGEGLCFLINSISFIPFIIGLLLMKEIPQRSPDQHCSIFIRVKEGFKVAGENSVVRNLLLLIALLGFVGMSFFVLLPVLSDQVLKVGSSGFGQLIGAAGTGALLAALTFAGYKNLKGLGRWMTISTIIFGLSLISLSLSVSFYLSAVLLFFLGFSQVVQLDSANKLIQLTASDQIRGRLMSFYVLVLMGLTPCGVLLTGWLANQIGIRKTMAICGIVYLVFALIIAIRLLTHIRAEQSHHGAGRNDDIHL